MKLEQTVAIIDDSIGPLRGHPGYPKALEAERKANNVELESLATEKRDLVEKINAGQATLKDDTLSIDAFSVREDIRKASRALVAVYRRERQAILKRKSLAGRAAPHVVAWAREQLSARDARIKAVLADLRKGGTVLGDPQPDGATFPKADKTISDPVQRQAEQALVRVLIQCDPIARKLSEDARDAFGVASDLKAMGKGRSWDLAHLAAIEGALQAQ